jgi:glutamate-5-semialdehyde dehydrogenase
MSIPDPNNKVLFCGKLSQDLELFKSSCPIGLILVIFEARPEFVVQIICLAIKSGNACILKGGKKAFNSNEGVYF